MQDLLHAPLLAIISGILPCPLTPVSSSARLKWRRAIMRCQTSDTLGVGSGPDGGLTGWRPPHVSSQEQLQTTLEPCCGGVVSFLPGLCSLLCCLFSTPTPRSITSSPAPVPLCSSRLLRVQSHYGTDTLNPFWLLCGWARILRRAAHCRPWEPELCLPLGSLLFLLFPLSSFLTSSPSYVPSPLALDTQLAPGPLLCVPRPHSSGCWGMPSHPSMATS